MLAAHQFFTTLAPAAVFTVLRYFGEALSSNRGLGLTGLPSIAKSLSSAPPSVEIARLLLHLAWETQGRQNSIFSFYLWINRQELENISDTIEPNSTDWDKAAVNILNTMNKDISIFYADNKWDIECANPQLKLVPEIRQLIEKLMDKTSQLKVIDSKNVLIDNNITTENLTIGDTHHHYYADQMPLPTPDIVRQMAHFSGTIRSLLHENRAVEALETVRAYTKAMATHRQTDVEKISQTWYTLFQKWQQGSLSEQEMLHEWNQIKAELTVLVQQLITIV